jgi:hypothetical protein
MMKLLVVLSIREIQDKVAKMLEKAGVEIFSVGDITGYKKRGYNVGCLDLITERPIPLSCSAFECRIGTRAIEIIEECNECNQSRSRACIHLNVDEFLKVE